MNVHRIGEAWRQDNGSMISCTIQDGVRCDACGRVAVWHVQETESYAFVQRLGGDGDQRGKKRCLCTDCRVLATLIGP